MNTLLLSPQLRLKVEARVKECLDIAEAEYGQKFDFPEIRYDVKNTYGGLAYYHKWMIRLNLILMVENEEHFIKQTVGHEVAHLINHKMGKPAEGKKLMPHGKEWKKVMGILGLPAKTTHNYDVTSIDKAPRKKRSGVKVDRVEQIMAMIHKLSQEEQSRIIDRIDNVY